MPALTRALDDEEETQWGAIISEDASEAIAAIQARQAMPSKGVSFSFAVLVVNKRCR